MSDKTTKLQKLSKAFEEGLYHIAELDRQSTDTTLLKKAMLTFADYVFMTGYREQPSRFCTVDYQTLPREAEQYANLLVADCKIAAPALRAKVFGIQGDEISALCASMMAGFFCLLVQEPRETLPSFSRDDFKSLSDQLAGAYQRSGISILGSRGLGL